MKVLHILYKVMPSGAEKMLEVAAERFAMAGVEGHILANDDEDGEYAPNLRAAGYTLHRIPWTNSRRHLVAFWKLCRKQKFDVVHIHVIRGYAGFALAARLAGVKTIVKTFHGLFYPKDWMRLVWHVYQRRLAALLGVKFHAISLSVQRNEWARYRTRTTLIWNWIDERAFPLVDKATGRVVRSQLGVAPDAFVLLSVGNCHSASHMRIKNHRLILDAIARLPVSLRSRLVYVHVGNEAEGCPERLLAGKLGILDCVKFLGPRNDVYDLLCAADLFVMSSLHEGLGNSVIEALASGREPLLVSAPGLVDFGKVIPSVRYCRPDSEDMALAFARYLNGTWPVLSSQTLRENALAVFSLNRGVEELLRLYMRQQHV